jgi:hypothetical protein
VTPRQVLQVALQTAANRSFDLRSWWEEYMEGPAPPTSRTVASVLLRHHDYPFARALFGDEAGSALHVMLKLSLDYSRR